MADSDPLVIMNSSQFLWAGPGMQMSFNLKVPTINSPSLPRDVALGMMPAPRRPGILQSSARRGADWDSDWDTLLAIHIWATALDNFLFAVLGAGLQATAAVATPGPPKKQRPRPHIYRRENRASRKAWQQLGMCAIVSNLARTMTEMAQAFVKEWHVVRERKIERKREEKGVPVQCTHLVQIDWFRFYYFVRTWIV